MDWKNKNRKRKGRKSTAGAIELKHDSEHSMSVVAYKMQMYAATILDENGGNLGILDS